MSNSNAPYLSLPTADPVPLSSPPAYSPSTLESLHLAPGVDSKQEHTSPLAPAPIDSSASLLVTRRRRHRRAIIFSFLSIVAGAVFLAAGMGAGVFGGLCGGQTREMMRQAVVGGGGGAGVQGAQQPAAEVLDGGLKLAKRGAVVGEREAMKRELTLVPEWLTREPELRAATTAKASPTFSTSVYENGETSTFVYTTRAIVNPGGFTIGTLTGYVHETATPSAKKDAIELSTIPTPTPTARKA